MAGLALVVGVGLEAEPMTRKQIDSINAPARDHHLFVGLDLFVQEEDGSLPVRRVDADGSVVETEAGRLERRPVIDGFVWRKTAKVAPVAVQIADFKEQRVYSAVANPQFERESQQANLFEYFTTRQSLADREMRYLEARIRNAETARANGENAPTAAELTAQTFDNVAAATMELRRFSTDIAPGAPGAPGTEGDDGELYDGLVLEFEATASQRIAEVSAVVMIRVRNRQDQYQDFNYSRVVGAIGPEARQVRIVQFDLPPGFELVSSELHLFSRGEELATDRSERHMALSGAEAREFALQTHLAEHRGQSAPAGVVWSLAPEALRSAESGERFDHAARVRIDETGAFIAIETASEAVVPAPVREVLESLVYLPPLEEGRAVAGTLEVNPSDYFRRVPGES